MEYPIDLSNGLIIHSAKNPVWSNREKTTIDITITVTWAGVFEEPTELPFTAAPWDSMEHGRDLFEHFLKAGSGPAPYERPEVTVEDLEADLDKLMPDIYLGLATEAEISLAKSLRIQIKAMSA